MTHRFADDVLMTRGAIAIPTVRTLLRQLGQTNAPLPAQQAAVRGWCSGHAINDSLAADLRDRGWDEPAKPRLLA